MYFVVLADTYYFQVQVLMDAIVFKIPVLDLIVLQSQIKKKKIQGFQYAVPGIAPS